MKRAKSSIDRTREYSESDPVVTVVLEGGEQYDFAISGLKDKEYIERARYIQSIERWLARKPIKKETP